MNLIISYLRPYRFKIFLFLFCSCFSSLLGVGVLAFINNYLLRDPSMQYLLYFILLLVLFFASSLLVELSLSAFGQNFIFSMQKRVVKQILDSSVLDIERIGKAKLLASLGNDVRTLSFGLLRFPEFLQASILILASSIYLCFLSPKIFLLCAFIIVFIVLINYQFMIRSYRYFKKARDSDDALQDNYQELIDGRKELGLNIFRAKFYYENDFSTNARFKKHSNFMSSAMSSLSNNFTSVCFLALVGLEFYVALTFSWTSLENATTIAIAILFLRAPLLGAMSSLPTLLMAKVALEKITHLNLSKFKEDFILEKAPTWEKIELKNVAFAYDNKFSLKPTNLSISKGELIFLIGKNGSGKSTLSMIIAGLIMPSEGAIYLDDTKITHDNILKYRSLISAVFSDFHLFTQLLEEENLASEVKIKAWLETLELFEKVRVEDAKLDTTKLSSGQRKRLALLVALLEERQILILDEFAADQDPLFRRFFYHKILPLLKAQGKTLWVISHDDKYFDMADRIFLAQNGEVSELKGEISSVAKNAVDHF